MIVEYFAAANEETLLMLRWDNGIILMDLFSIPDTCPLPKEPR